jgi:hypothetical protein
VRFGHAVAKTDFLTDETRAEPFRHHPTDGGEWTFYGPGWRVGRSEEWGFFYGHGGGGEGVAANLLLVPDHDLVACVLSNGDANPSWDMGRSAAETFIAARRAPSRIDPASGR